MKVYCTFYLGYGMFRTQRCFTLRWFTPILFHAEMVHIAMFRIEYNFLTMNDL